MRIVSAILLLAACSGAEDPTAKTTDTDTDTDTDTIDTQIVDSALSTADTGTTPTEPLCLNGVLGRFPANGTTDAFFFTSVEFALSTVDTEATIAVEGPDGTVSGSSEVLGKRVRWTSTDPLTPSSSYTATLSWECADETTSFTTSSTGEAIPVAEVSDKAYRLNLQAGRWIQPAGIGGALAALLGADILIGVDSPSANELSLTFARSDGFGGPQDPCEPTTLFPPADFSTNPLFLVGPADVALEISGQPMPVFGLEMSGAFTPGGNTIEGGRLAGVIDTAPLVPVITGGTDPFEVCAVLVSFGVSCLPCPQGGTATCVQIEVDSIDGALESGGVVTRTPADIQTDPSCP
jgi:hypothetical protein